MREMTVISLGVWSLQQKIYGRGDYNIELLHGVSNSVGGEKTGN